MAIRREDVFVLKRFPIRETSLLVTFFARGAGKLRALAKGVRQEKRPLSARFEPFTRLSIVYYEKQRSDTHLLSETVVLESNAEIRDRLDRFGYASYMVELVDTFFGAHDPHPEVFDLLAASFRELKRIPAMDVARAFQVKLLERAGLVPALTQCVLCGQSDLPQAFFSPRQGGILCRRCDRGETGTIRVSHGTLQSLRFFLRGNMEQAAKLKLGRQTERELDRIISKFLQFRLEYPLKSPLFLAELKPILSKIV
ncbi:MAG: DNA repair protein RecO [Candidatus Omnitrophica bacterium]|nr:DNA repair protein RecO [Candidatus Omnitrophota bacterium]